ncbi:MAG: hypothetical protein WCH39_11910 [Schlesneria sp.]
MEIFDFHEWNGTPEFPPQGKATEPIQLFPFGPGIMVRRILVAIAAFQLLRLSAPRFAEEILFEETFNEKLSPQWKVTGLKEDECRIKNGGLEMRVSESTKRRKE